MAQHQKDEGRSSDDQSHDKSHGHVKSGSERKTDADANDRTNVSAGNASGAKPGNSKARKGLDDPRTRLLL